MNNWLFKDKLLPLSNIYNLSQVVTKSTNVSYKSNGTKMVPYIGLIVYNAVDLCSTADSTPAGLSDHNSVSVSRKTKGPKLRKHNCKRTFKQFSDNEYVKNLNMFIGLGYYLGEILRKPRLS